MAAKNQSSELPGERRGRLVVVAKSDRTKDGRTIVECLCDCGNTAHVTLNNIRNGNTKSCGCLSNEVRAARAKKNAKHQMSGTAEYHAWEAIIQRCTNPKSQNYPEYGGRGITVCEKWRDFKAFFEDMGKRPPKTSIDRIDNNGPYAPCNCRWTTASTQMKNTRKSNYFTVEGVRAHITDWGRESGITPNLIRARLRGGWSAKAALTTPHIRKNKNRATE